MASVESDGTYLLNYSDSSLHGEGLPLLWNAVAHAYSSYLSELEALKQFKRANAGFYLNRLAHFADLTLISYNYDLIAEDAIVSDGTTRLNLTDAYGPPADTLPTLPTRLGLKPHGALNWCWSPMSAVGISPNGQISMQHCRGMPAIAKEDWKKFKTCPRFPAIVPPGAAKLRSMLVSPTQEKFISQRLQQADLVVVLGLSGRAPDDEEFERLFHRVQQRPVGVIFGLKSSLNEPLAQLMKRTCRIIDFVDGARGMQAVWRKAWGLDLPWLENI